MAKNSESILDDIINQEFTEMKDLSKEDTSVSHWIDSGNYALNYVCSKHFEGAYPAGQITALVGKSGAGKSMLPSFASKDIYFDRVIVLDSEGGGTGSALFKFVNAPLEKIRYMTVKTLDNYKINKTNGKMEEVSDKDMPAKMSTDTFEYHMGLNLILKKLLYALEYNHSEEKVLIIVDSLSNISSVRKLSGVADMGKTNQLLNQMFSSLDTTLANTKATLMFAGKVYTDLNNAYNTEGIVTGGEAVMYNPSLMLNLTILQDNPELSDAELKSEKEQRKTGLGNSIKTIRVRVKKSRFGTEGRNAWVILDSTYGLIRNSGLFQLLVDFGVCIKNGTRYSIPGIIVDEKGKDLYFYKKDFPEIFSKNEKEYIDKLQKAMDEKEEEIKSKRLALNINDTDEVSDEENNEEISTRDMINAMEAEMEIDREE